MRVFLMVGLAFSTALARPAYAKVQVVRDDPESPFVSVAKSTFYGAVFGSAIGLAIMLVAEGNDEDIFKVAFVSGTALGLGYGIFHVATRPGQDAQALLRIDPGGARVAVPRVQFQKKDDRWGAKVNLLSATF